MGMDPHCPLRTRWYMYGHLRPSVTQQERDRNNDGFFTRYLTGRLHETQVPACHCYYDVLRLGAIVYIQSNPS